MSIIKIPLNQTEDSKSKNLSGQLVMYVDEITTAFPTSRGDGSLLQNQDYVKVKPTATCPFTIKGLTFNTKDDIAFYYNGDWHMWTGSLQVTSEIIVSDKKTESISGTASSQRQVNIEVKNILSPSDNYPRKRILTIDKNGGGSTLTSIANSEDIEEYLKISKVL